jgi:hypothetical protein
MGVVSPSWLTGFDCKIGPKIDEEDEKLKRNFPIG